MSDWAMDRLRRKLEQKDRRISGLERRISQLEHALATRSMDIESLSRNVERSVTRALCNVRMIPVHGMSGTRIVDVKLTDTVSAKTPTPSED